MRNMSVSAEIPVDGIVPSRIQAADDDLSELGDGSSSLSDIEDKEPEQDELDELDDLDDQDQDSDNEDESDTDDSEAETERLENSPHQHKPKEVILGENRTYYQTPSKLHHQFNDEEEAEDDDDDDDVDNELDRLSDDDGSVAESAKSNGMDGVERDPTTATTSLEDSSGEGKGSMAALDAASKKRKRSLLPDRDAVDATELDEPARKRTGSIPATDDDYAIDDTASANGGAETSNPISGEVSDAESNDPHDDEDEDNPDEELEEVGAEDDVEESLNLVKDSRPKGERKTHRHKRDGSELVDNVEDDAIDVPSEAVQEAVDGDSHEDAMDVDEAELALKNEEERKSI